MAAAFLASHGINLDEEIILAYRSTLGLQGEIGQDQKIDITPPIPVPVRSIPNVVTGNGQKKQTVIIDSEGHISAITEGSDSFSIPTRLALPSLAHPHIHLDKPYLLSHSDTCHLEPKTGDFQEALSLTAEAKPLYTVDALLERGAQLLADSSRAGVTHLRGFCEVDTAVSLKCITAGVKLKNAWRKCLYVQIAAFAQDPLFSTKANGTGLSEQDQPKDFMPDGNQNFELLQQAVKTEGIEVLATTPYMEASSAASKRNIDWAIQTAIEHNLHLDFHLDYNLDPEQEPLIWHVLDKLKEHRWSEWQETSRTICLGHCTRLTLFSAREWRRLVDEIADLPVYFIGLPTSDLFRQGRANIAEDPFQAATASHNRPRATLHIPSLLSLGLNAAIGINNIGNAFTPFGSSDPLHVAKWCIGIYQNGTAKAARTLYGCVSWRAKQAMGLISSTQDDSASSEDQYLSEKDEANMIIFGSPTYSKKFMHHRRSMEEVVWNPPPENQRMVIYKGRHVDV